MEFSWQLRNHCPPVLLASLLLLVHCFCPTADARQSQQEKLPAEKDIPLIDNDALLSAKQPIELLNSTLQKGVTEQSNFVYLVWKTFGTDFSFARSKPYFDRLGLPLDSAGSIKFSKWMDYANENKLRKRELNPAEYKDRSDVDKWVVQEKAALDFAEKIASSPHYFSPVAIGDRDIVKVFPRAAIISRYIVDGLIARSNMRMRQGDLDGAWESIFASFQISRLVSQEPSLDGSRSRDRLSTKKYIMLCLNCLSMNSSVRSSLKSAERIFLRSIHYRHGRTNWNRAKKRWRCTVLNLSNQVVHELSCKS